MGSTGEVGEKTARCEIERSARSLYSSSSADIERVGGFRRSGCGRARYNPLRSQIRQNSGTRSVGEYSARMAIVVQDRF